MIKKICFFTTHFAHSRQRLLEYYEKILPKDVEIFLFCQENIKNEFKLKRIKKISYNCSKPYVFLKLRKFCKKNNIDVLTNVSGGSSVGFTLILTTIFTKTKNLFYGHGNPKFKAIFTQFFLQLFLNRILYCSPDIVRKAKKALFLSKNKLFPLEVLVDTDFFKPKNKKLCRKKLGLNQKDKIILHVSRIHPSKGSEYLLELIKRNPNKKFILVGELMDENYKKRELKNVIFISKTTKEKLKEYYCAADLFIFLSQREGYGLPPREAMACGTPAIVSDILAVRLIQKAIKVPFDMEIAQKEIDNFFELSEKQRKKLSQKSKECILNDFPQEKIKKDHLKYFLDF